MRKASGRLIWALSLCAALAGTGDQAGVARAGRGDIITDPFPGEQAQVKKRIDEIIDAAQKKDLDRLDSYHLYSPKFTKFEDDMLGRQDAAAGRKGEREALAGVKSFQASVEDLKVDVFGPVAVATLILKYQADTGKEKAAGSDRSTLVLLKGHDSWKIVHEHSSPLKAPGP